MWRAVTGTIAFVADPYYQQELARFTLAPEECCDSRRCDWEPALAPEEVEEKGGG